MVNDHAVNSNRVLVNVPELTLNQPFKSLCTRLEFEVIFFKASEESCFWLVINFYLH